MTSTSTTTNNDVTHDNHNNGTQSNGSTDSLLYGKYLNYCSLSRQEMVRLANGSDHDREASIETVTINGGKPDDKKDCYRALSSDEILQLQDMTWYEELVAIVVLAISPPNVVFTIPIVTTLFGYFVLHNVSLAFQYLFLFVLLPLTILPRNRFHPSILTNSYVSYCIIKYFSFRFITYEKAPIHHKGVESTTNDNNDTVNDKATTNQSYHQSQICVAPPHGVFPYGNILAMLIWPSLTGYYFHGLASSAALRVPISKQILSSIGVVDASRHVAESALTQYPYTIGISTGGVAEIFATNDHNECIILKERIGLIKLAIRTQSDLVPCYLFGNTQLLSCYCFDNIPTLKRYIEKLSRILGFGIIIFYGRYFLPMPYRIPILGIRGKAISTKHLMGTTNPTMEQVLDIQNQLLHSMQQLFDDNKHLYHWETKQLIIK